MGAALLKAPASIFTKTPIGVQLEVTEIDADYTTYKLMLQVWVETTPYSDEWMFLAEMEQPATPEFDATFYIDGKLREALHFNLPLIGGEAIQTAEQVCRRYKLKMGLKLTTSMELIEEYYHTLSGYQSLPVATPLELDVPYLLVAYTSRLSALAEVKFFDGASTANANFLASGLWGNRAVAYVTVSSALVDNISLISIPANIKFELFKLPVEYAWATDEVDAELIFGALLGAESLRSFGLPVAENEAAFDEAFDLAFQSPYVIP